MPKRHPERVGKRTRIKRTGTSMMGYKGFTLKPVVRGSKVLYRSIGGNKRGRYRRGK